MKLSLPFKNLTIRDDFHINRKPYNASNQNDVLHVQHLDFGSSVPLTRGELGVDDNDYENCVATQDDGDDDSEEGRFEEHPTKCGEKGQGENRCKYRYWPPLSFLDLPTAVRLHVYEYLPILTKYVTGIHDSSGRPGILLIMKYLDRTILQTCRTIRDEAEAIIEIQTMQLGPPRILASVSSIHRVHEFIGEMNRHQDEGLYQRLRLRDEHRSDLSLQSIGCLMWTRIALLQQLSRKEIQIGIHFPSSGCFPLLSKNRRAILSDINAAAEGIVSYWHSKDWSSPRFTVVVEQAFPLAYDEGLERLLGSWGIGIEYHSAESISEMWATGSLGEVFEE